MWITVTLPWSSEHQLHLPLRPFYIYLEKKENKQQCTVGEMGQKGNRFRGCSILLHTMFCVTSNPENPNITLSLSLSSLSQIHLMSPSSSLTAGWWPGKSSPRNGVWQVPRTGWYSSWILFIWGSRRLAHCTRWPFEGIYQGAATDQSLPILKSDDLTDLKNWRPIITLV